MVGFQQIYMVKNVYILSEKEWKQKTERDSYNPLLSLGKSVYIWLPIITESLMYGLWIPEEMAGVWQLDSQSRSAP